MVSSGKFTPKVKQLGKDEMGRIKLGASLAREGRVDEAVAEFQAVLATNPNSFRAHTALGMIRLKQKSYDESLLHFETAMKLDPTKPQAPLKVAKLYLKQGDLVKAQAYYQSTLALDPKSASAYQGSGQVYLQEEKYDEAIQQFRKALKLDPSLTQVRQRLAQAYAKVGKTAEAAVELKAALASGETPKNANPYLQLAKLASSQNDFQGAAEAFEQALKINPDLKPSAKLGYVQALIEVNRLETAIAELKAFPQNQRTAPIQHKLWGDVYTKQGLFKEAAEEYQAATLLSKTGDDALDDLEDLDTIDADDNWSDVADMYRESANSLVETARKRNR